MGVASAQISAPLPSSTDAIEPRRFALAAEALAWWFKETPAPVPLVTDGLFGEANTRVFLGGSSLDTGTNPGLRVGGGYAVSSRFSVEGSVFYVPSRSTSASVSSSGQLGSTDLVIPFIDARTGRESGTELSLAPVFSGSAREELTNNLLGAELNGAWALRRDGAWRTDLLGGFRYLRLRETYRLTSDSPYIPPFPQDIWITNDELKTTNHFYGAQVGVRAQMDQGAFFGNGTIKVALGAMDQQVSINGSLLTNDYTDYGAARTYTGGWFALGSNIGDYSRTRFAVMPELALNVGYRLTPAATVTLGYTLLYANNVVRPGNHIIRTLNVTQSTTHTEDPAAQLNGPAQPAFQWNDSAFWAQGLSLGVAVRF
jgi:hypothetical protein